MRRALFWYVPLTVTAAATLLFAAGFVTWLRGDIGDAVTSVASTARASSAPRGTIAPLILGDSLARGTGDETGLGIGGRLAAILKEEHVNARPPVNLAVNGARTPDLLTQLDSRNVRLLIGSANVIVISIGGNDLWGEARGGPAPHPDQASPLMTGVLDRVTQIVRIVRQANPTARIFIVGLYNPFARAPFGALLGALVTDWNAKLAGEFAGDPNITVVPTADLFSHRARLSFDNFHPNDEGYQLIARRIAESL